MRRENMAPRAHKQNHNEGESPPGSDSDEISILEALCYVLATCLVVWSIYGLIKFLYIVL